MKKNAYVLVTLLVVATLLLSACDAVKNLAPKKAASLSPTPAKQATSLFTSPTDKPADAQPTATANQPPAVTATPAANKAPTTTPAKPTAAPVQPTATTAAQLPADVTRIEFKQGKTSHTVKGEIETGKTASYALSAQQGQKLSVDIWSPNGDVYLGIAGADGQAVVKTDEKKTTWTGDLPATQDYILSALAAGASSYSMHVDLEPASSGQSQPTAKPTTAPAVEFDPYATYGQPTLIDPMNGGNKTDWVGSDGAYPDNKVIQIAVKSARFFVTGKMAGWSTWWFSWRELDNFYLEMTSNTLEDCSGQDAYGLIIRGPEHASGTSYGYVAAFSCDGAFTIYRLDGADPFSAKTLVDWTESEYINAGPNEQNVMGLKASGSTLTLYANGYQVAEVTDAKYNVGRYGVYVSPQETDDFTYRISRLAYWIFKKP